MKKLITIAAIAITLVSCNPTPDFNWKAEKARLESMGASIHVTDDGESAFVRFDYNGKFQNSFFIDTETGMHEFQVFNNYNKINQSK